MVINLWGRWFLVGRNKTTYGTWHMLAPDTAGQHPERALCGAVFERWQTSLSQPTAAPANLSAATGAQKVCAKCVARGTREEAAGV